ncbi:MAG: ABC transporter permease [Alphaproteobacteria bacterium RIFCSPHIGHO2_02_FULL_46_13]|nr:MAG: ABC transporter permease [Alphaproteobacteria bacterium RIFCSPHIGHO2_02_FULL_46_13]
MRLLAFIALKHLLARKRQSFVSLMGIILGVAFFLGISSIMQGSEQDFIKRLVDNSPHITISDEYREPRIQPAQKLYKDSMVSIRNVTPLTETRGIRGYEKILGKLKNTPGLVASPVLAGQGIITYAGQETGITLSGMIPEEIDSVSTIRNYMVEGSLERLFGNPDGILIGVTLAKDLSLSLNDMITVVAPSGDVKRFKIVGIFKTGRGGYDRGQGFINLKRAQTLFNRPNRINSILVKLDDPQQALAMSKDIESIVGYKSESWQEQSADLMNTLAIRNIIMYSVVSAVLIVAAFGIYNVISTVVMEKHRDIAILKSMGFQSEDIRRIFLIQGVLLGIAGNMIGIPLGALMIQGLSNIKFKPPGSSDVIYMPVSWGFEQFVIAAAFAICAAVLAAYLPARKGAQLMPVDVLRGGS